MNKTDELIYLEFNTLEVQNIEIFKYQIKKLMLRYAEYYAQKVISEIKKPENKIYHPEFGMRSYIIEDDFKLPEHE